MALESGYQYMVLGSFTATVNPTEYLDVHAVKKFVDVVTLTATITQHWQIKDSDKTAWMRWATMSLSEKNALKTLYEADYTSYNFTDIYGNSYNVVIVDMPVPKRKSSLDRDGFEVQILLKLV